ncbi:MAG: M48 family metallopeptidase, partial [Gammaproteobacteria bacterium]|nr:M48 family metallopeptidase [Gammaproteobacteria bacterium]
TASYANAQELPQLGNYSSTTLSSAKEQRLGKQFMLAVEQQSSVNHDPLITDYINTIGDKLVQYTDNRDTQFHFFVVNSSEINAFAGPGGYIGVNSALILTTKTESELASVLAHEITHVNQHHIARSMAHAKALSLPTLAAIVAAAAIGATTHSDATADAAMGAVMAAIGGTSQNMTTFTRNNEKEADRIGLQTLYNAGFNPMAMPAFFHQMQQSALAYGSEIPAYLQDHPVTDVRIADAENRAKQYSKRKVTSSLDYYLMRARLRVATTKNNRDAVDYFKAQLQTKSYQNLAAAEYGYTVALTNDHKPQAAVQVINKLIAKAPNQVVYQMALAEAQLNKKQYHPAIKTLKHSLAFYPDYYPLIVEYARTLLKAKQPNQARLFLQRQVLDYPNDELIYALLAIAQGKSGHLADAYQSRARICVLYGDLDMAIVQLHQAQKLPNLSSNTKAILAAKIKKLKKIRKSHKSS